MAPQGKSSKERLGVAERRQRVALLRKAGGTLQQIADTVGVNKSTISRDLDHLVKQLEIGPAQELVTWELAMLNDAQKSIWAKVTQGHLGAIDQFRKLSESRRKLLGLDAPSKVDLGLADVDLDSVVTEMMQFVTGRPAE